MKLKDCNIKRFDVIRCSFVLGRPCDETNVVDGHRDEPKIRDSYGPITTAHRVRESHMWDEPYLAYDLRHHSAEKLEFLDTIVILQKEYNPMAHRSTDRRCCCLKKGEKKGICKRSSVAQYISGVGV